MKDKKKFIYQIKQKIKEKIRVDGIENLSNILDSFKSEYLNGIKNFGISDPEQSWKPFKGNFLEEIILESIINEINKLGLLAIKGSELERQEGSLNECYAKAKRSIVVDYGKYGMHLPDADLIIINPKDDCKVVAIISSKTTLRERIAQTGYWCLKLRQGRCTKNVKTFFITLDEDGDFTQSFPAKKGRAIAEKDTDGTFIITNKPIEESSTVKKFKDFLIELKKIV
ncbi:MAG: BsaWI family type II restriction enzyme [Ignavibacteria bacterium]|nr:BsaWI family type II restriction enzyme [Ignavibacteria bacterium]